MKKLILLTVIFISSISYAQDIFSYCANGDLDAVKKAVESGVDVNAPNPSSKQNAIAYAFFYPEITKYLLEKGADPNGGSYPAIVSASSVASLEVVKLLLDHGADPNKKGGNETALLKVVQMTNCAELAELLISKGADVKTTTGAYANLIGVYASYGLNQKDRKEAMIKYGTMLKKWNVTAADWYMNPDDNLNAPPQDMLKVLIKNGLDINERNKNILDPKKQGETPLFTAMNVGNMDIIMSLLENGADYNATYDVINKGLTLFDVKGEYTPLMYACVKGYTEVVRWLVQKPDLVNTSISGKTVNEKKTILTIKGLSAIYLAIMSGNSEIVKLIAETSFTYEDLTIKLLSGQKFEGSYGSKENEYTFAKTKKKSLKYTPSLFAGFTGQEDLETYLKSKNL